jgi:cytochrome c biogenesis protein CcmG/thiol:disulfide interchange protein DsbE
MAIIAGIMLFAALLGKYFVNVREEMLGKDQEIEILKNLPQFEAINFESGQAFDKKNLLDMGADGFVIHFWATWCAPCEAEFPDLLNLIERLRKRNIVFVTIAVNDDSQKAKKYLSRFEKYKHPNLIHLDDPKGLTLEKFGTVKVPETYVFRSDGSSYKKLVGPQNWLQEYYFQLLSNVTRVNKSDYKIESH